PLAQSPVELRSRPMLVAFAVEAGLHDRSRRVPTRTTSLVVGKAQSLPAMIDVDDGADDRPRLCSKRIELRDELVGGFLLVRAFLDSVDPLPGEARNAAILVLRGFGHLAEAFRCRHPTCSLLPCLGTFGAERDVDEEGFIANVRERNPAPVGICGAARDIG